MKKKYRTIHIAFRLMSLRLVFSLVITIGVMETFANKAISHLEASLPTSYNDMNAYLQRFIKTTDNRAGNFVKAENLLSSSVAENTVNISNRLDLKLTILNCRCGEYIYSRPTHCVVCVHVCVCVCVCVCSSRYPYMARIMYCTTTISESCLCDSNITRTLVWIRPIAYSSAVQDFWNVCMTCNRLVYM